jgi:hypothetical protein
MLGTVAQVAAQLRALLAAGIDYPLVNIVYARDEGKHSLFAEALRFA